MLLPEDLQKRLPPLYSQEAESEPHVYARLMLPGTTLAWYLIEVEAQGNDFLCFGFICGQENEFGYFRLSELESLRSPLGASVERDAAFMEGKLTDVVPAPDI